ncbi:DUF1413 domain-containing protein [Proteiniclasticum sp. BAD-10]|uniref:DUF1413 domain-containing protein n=1 Tax=Proteiniclasticum sediminis TaxID=2804028 RepID=A0A941CRI5_9CLOT|nr:DUF1413 domain-containing protein [Proteiniclasticum sediminis]MBR0576458.1 DUF1413 domain-containing protein [Proteiniclasticum sediminis]
MKIDVNKIISPEDLLDDFEGICERLESDREAFIFQNNKPTHVIMTIKHYQNMEDSANEQVLDITDHPENEDIDTLLNKIGRRVFIEYYYVFKADDNPEEKLIKEEFTLNSRRSRSSSARKIFRDGLQVLALKSIIQSSKLDEEILARAKNILVAEIGDNLKNDSVDEHVIEKGEMKIGKTVRFLFTRFLQGDFLTESEIKSMTDEEYSKKTFNINFQVLKIVDVNTPIEDQKRDLRGYNRYYDSPIVTAKHKYLLCSQWVESLHRKSFELWLEEKLMSILLSRVEVLNTGTEFGIRDLLSDFWQYVPHSTLRTLGKRFNYHALSHGEIDPIEKRNNNQFYRKL